MRPGFVYSCALNAGKVRGAILIAWVGGLVESGRCGPGWWGWGVSHLCTQKKDNVAIAVRPMQIFKWASNYLSGRQFTARHAGAKLKAFWCYTSSCTQHMSNFTGGRTATEALRQWRSSVFFSLSLSLSLSPSLHLGPSQWWVFIKEPARLGVAKRKGKGGGGWGRGVTNYW